MPTYRAIASSDCWLPTLGVNQNKSFFTTNNSVLARGAQYSCWFLNACQLKKLFRYNLGWVRGSEGSQDPSPQNSVPNWKLAKQQPIRISKRFPSLCESPYLFITKPTRHDHKAEQGLLTAWFFYKHCTALPRLDVTQIGEKNSMLL